MDLKNLGWILSESGLKSLDANANSKSKIQFLLNKDLRDYGAGISDLHKGKLENIEHELIVLQILKLRNISAPKANENSKTAPKLLKLQLTDGQNNYSAIEMEPTALSLENTPPGTKISLKVKHLKIASSQLLLTPKNMEILGGYVEALASKWEISRSLANQMKENRSGGAPPFIPFGQKIQQNVSNDKSFKSLQQGKQKENEENSEFDAQRQDAIAEASRAATRKTFGGGQKTLVDSNVQKIMDKGYSEEQAVTALKFARNNVEKALGNLKRREERQQQRGASSEQEPRESHENSNRRQEKRGAGGKGNASSDPPPAKPSTGVSLFDFLEKKIPETTSTAKQSSSYGHERFENNISSSFQSRKYDKDNSNKSQWSQQYSSNATSSDQKSSQKYSKSSYNSRNDYYESSSAREPRGERNDRSERGDHYRGSNNYRGQDRGGEKQSYYQGANNFSSKSNANNISTNSSSSYNRNAAMSNQKQSNVSNGSQQAPPYSSNNRNTERDREKGGKYGQKPDYESNRNSGKDYNNSYSRDQQSSGYQQRRSNYSTENKNQQRNITESMEKMSLKGNQQYKSYDSYHSKDTKSQQSSQGYSSNYMPAGFQSKEANDQAKTALKTKNIPSGPQVSNWQQPQVTNAPIPTPPQTVPIQVPVPVIPQSTMKTGPPPFAAPQIHPLPQPFPVMAMPTAQPAVYTYQATPIIMQSVPPPMQQPTPTGIPQLKINDQCLAKYWEDGKFYNAKITGVSESTYVVLFTDYGNAEEVRKTDCVPLMVPTCPTPPQANFVAPPQMGGYRIPAQKMPDQQHQPQHSYHSQSQSMPYKGGPKRRN